MEKPLRQTSLFRHFLVARLRPKAEQANEFEPLIRMRLSAPDIQSELLPKDVIRFCFPDLGDFHHSSRFVSEAFTFVLTEENGTRTFGFCRRQLQESSKNNLLECLCMLTSFPFFSLFEHVMEHVQIRWNLEPRAVIPFLQALLNAPVPPPNKAVNVTIRAKDNTDDSRSNEHFSFYRPRYSHLSVRVECLLKQLSVDKLMIVMSALLCERRIIFCSRNVSILSRCIHAVVALLFPFRWQHIFIPVLSTSLLHYVCAPMPFLVGIRQRDVAKVLKLPIESVLLVRLDDDIVESHKGTVDIVPFPPGPGSKLRSHLSAVVPNEAPSIKKGLNTILGKSTESDHVMLSESIHCLFMAFYVITFGNWRNFMHQKRDGTVQFNMELFLEHARTRSTDDYNFLQTIRHSQLFESFTAERMAELRDRKSSSVFSDILSSVNLSSSEQLSFTSILSSVRRVMLRADMGQIASIALMKTSSSSSTNSAMSFGSLAKMTYSCVGLTEIMNVVWARLAQCQGRHWKHALSSLRLVLTLLESGSDAVVAQCRDRLSDFLFFSRYSHREPEIQNDVRRLGEKVVNTLMDLRSMSQLRSPRYAMLSSLKAFAVTVQQGAGGAAQKHAVDFKHQNQPQQQEPVQQLLQERMKRSLSFERFPSKAVQEVTTAANRSWRKYRIKSIKDRQVRIIPKFSRLHRKMKPDLPAVSQVAPASGDIEHLLGAVSIQTPENFGHSQQSHLNLGVSPPKLHANSDNSRSSTIRNWILDSFDPIKPSSTAQHTAPPKAVETFATQFDPLLETNEKSQAKTRTSTTLENPLDRFWG